MHQCCPTSKDLHQLSVDTGCSFKDLPEEMDDRDKGERARESRENLCCQHDFMMMVKLCDMLFYKHDFCIE